MRRGDNICFGGQARKRAAPRLDFFCAAVLILLTVIICGAAGQAAAKSKAVSWKAIEDALLRVNDSPVKDWGVYQAGRKTDPLLLQMGNRFLLIEIHERRIFEIDPSKVEHKTATEHKDGIVREADDLIWDPANCPAMPLVTSDWVEHDVGGAFQISAKIDAESRNLDLQLPHPPNIGDLPARSATPAQRRNR